MRQQSLSDQHLVRLAREGDNEAFGELTRRHWYKCVNLATTFLRNREDAEDEVQNAFSKAYVHLDQYNGEAQFSTWMMHIVANQCRMLLRVKRRTCFVYLDATLSDDGAAPMSLPAHGPDPECEFAFREIWQRLELEIRRTPPRFRKLLLLRDIQELPLWEVANQLGVTVCCAKSRLMRARAELRLRLLRWAG